MTLRVGLAGGTGIEGRGLALRFAQAGLPVAIGSRARARAESAAAACNALLAEDRIRGLENRELPAASDLVFLTVPFDQSAAAVETLLAHWRPGCILVDVTVPIDFREGRAEYREIAAGSSAEFVASLLPTDVPLVGAFKTIPAHVMGELEVPLDCDVFVCGDAPEAKATVIDAARRIPGLRALDAGLLRAARTLERMTVLAIQLNRRYRRRGARYRIQGI
jgi:NADPH-dependent F420 reductase